MQFLPDYVILAVFRARRQLDKDPPASAIALSALHAAALACTHPPAGEPVPDDVTTTIATANRILADRTHVGRFDAVRRILDMVLIGAGGNLAVGAAAERSATLYRSALNDAEGIARYAARAEYLPHLMATVEQIVIDCVRDAVPCTVERIIREVSHHPDTRDGWKARICVGLDFDAFLAGMVEAGRIRLSTEGADEGCYTPGAWELKSAPPARGDSDA